MATELLPYIFFYGRCEEALAFYQSIFGGSYEILRVKDSPMASRMPPDSGERVMHATFTGDDVKFLASDGGSTKPVDTDAGNISIGLWIDDGERAARVFDALAAGGTVGMPLEPAQWGARFGMVTDKFGTEWMVTTPQ